MKNKKTRIAIISVVALLLVLIGVTYAYWLVTKTQINSNIISSACLDITLDNEANDINLSSQYPMSDEDGMKLTPYTFTVTNNCNTSIDYQVVLESIGSEEGAIKPSALQVALDTNAGLLSNRASVSLTVNGAYAAHRLGYGTLAASGNEGSSATHSLRIWIDENAPISEANKTFQSKITVTIGQGVSNPIKEGTMAYDILANNDEATTLSATWVNKEPAAETYNSVSKTANNWYGTSYTFDEETGHFQLSGNLVQATLTECRDGSKVCGEYTLNNATQDYGSSTLYKITSFTNATKADTTSTLYMTTQSITSKNDFSTPTADGEGGLYKTIDDLGESYYFRGDVTNNYVQFGTYSNQVLYTLDILANFFDNTKFYTTLEECEAASGIDYEPDSNCVETTSPEAGKAMYWRIVRINGDGTIRLIYDGTEKVENGIEHTATIGQSEYNIYTEDAKFAGYTYVDENENQVDSVVKSAIDTWYNTHLKTNYETLIADGIFCNDRSSVQKYSFYDWESETYIETTEENANYLEVYFDGSTRLKNASPKLTCTNKIDRYTTKTSLGNGSLSNPIGLLTADEAMFAGKNIGVSNTTYYLYSSESSWTMTPGYWATTIDTEVRILDGQGCVSESHGLRPVINLRADVEFTGDGSFETPYVIKIN